MPVVFQFEISSSSQGGPPGLAAFVGEIVIKQTHQGSSDRKDVTVIHEDISEDQLADLVRRTAEANSALMRGDVSRYLTLITHADDYTLMAPFGGAPTRGFDVSSEHLTELARFFKAGTSKLELVQSYASGNMVVLVMIERQRGEVGGLPDQDWSLRVTQVYRREESEWWLVHRRADPLVKGISLEQAAAIARS